MSDKDDGTSIVQLIEQFTAGAVLYHQGLEDEALRVQRKGQIKNFGITRAHMTAFHMLQSLQDGDLRL